MNDILPISSDIGQIIEPDLIRYSFNTVGWRIVGATILAVILIFSLIKWRQYLKNAYRRKALRTLSQITNDQNAFYEINKLLKLMCLQLFDRREVASLHGREWLDFLYSKLDENVKFDKQEMAHTTKAIYNTKHNEQIGEFNNFAAYWISSHNL